VCAYVHVCMRERRKEGELEDMVSCEADVRYPSIH
jgi:hypothetical protein